MYRSEFRVQCIGRGALVDEQESECDTAYIEIEEVSCRGHRKRCF